jgi:hypothetical protein
VSFVERPSKELLPNRELARFIRRFAALYGQDEGQNALVHRSLMHLANELVKSEDYPKARAKPLPSPNRITKVMGRKEFRNASMSLGEARRLLGDRSASKNELIELATSRFGIAKGRLNRSSIDEVVDIITAAADHEESLDVISARAEAAGRSRTS